MSEWRFVGTCSDVRGPVPDSETISIYGLNPWRYNWATLREGVPIILPDPSFSSREYWLRVYEIKKEELCVRFATGYIAQDTWGFYVPARPGDSRTLTAREPKYEGYWRASFDEESTLPWPTPDPGWMKRAAFLGILDDVEANAERIAYRGISICRLCNCCNGHEGLRLAGWEWPAGYRHYIVDHNVRPSHAFECFVKTRARDSQPATPC